MCIVIGITSANHRRTWRPTPQPDIVTDENKIPVNAMIQKRKPDLGQFSKL